MNPQARQRQQVATEAAAFRVALHQEEERIQMFAPALTQGQILKLRSLLLIARRTVDAAVDKQYSRRRKEARCA